MGKNYCLECAKKNDYTCCNVIAGGFSPKQLGLTSDHTKNYDKIISLLNTGLVVIRSPRTGENAYMKARNVSEFEIYPDHIVQYSYEEDFCALYKDGMRVHDCVFLQDGFLGCALDKEYRPYECFKLKGSSLGYASCYSFCNNFFSADIFSLWKNYQDLLSEIIQDIQKKNITLSPFRVSAFSSPTGILVPQFYDDTKIKLGSKRYLQYLSYLQGYEKIDVKGFQKCLR